MYWVRTVMKSSPTMRCRYTWITPAMVKASTMASMPLVISQNAVRPRPSR